MQPAQRPAPGGQGLGPAWPLGSSPSPPQLPGPGHRPFQASASPSAKRGQAVASVVAVKAGPGPGQARRVPSLLASPLRARRASDRTPEHCPRGTFIHSKDVTIATTLQFPEIGPLLSAFLAAVVAGRKAEDRTHGQVRPGADGRSAPDIKLRCFQLRPEMTPSVASALSDPQKRQDHTLPRSPRTRQGHPTFYSPPPLETSTVKKLSQYLQTRPLWATGLYLGEEIRSALPPHPGRQRQDL